MNSKNWLDVLKRLDKLIGRRGSELVYASPFQFAVSVLLSAQATYKSVNAATPALFNAAPTPEKMLLLGEEGVAKYVCHIGLWRAKSKNIIGLCEVLLREFGGKLPRTLPELIKLPGIGRKSANVIMNELYGAPSIAVDTHVIRLAGRFGLTGSKDPVEIERVLERLTPAEYKPLVSNLLVLFGRYHCKAVKPNCALCPVREWCKISSCYL